MENSITLNEVLALAGRLSPIDKVRLIEGVAPQIERELPDQAANRADDLPPGPMADAASTLADYAAVLADSDHVRDQIQQRQMQSASQMEDSVATLHQLREARDAGFDHLR
ncbi:MAG TPA: hypothetical protein VII92_12715 [Anaerolineae bacterium]